MIEWKLLLSLESAYGHSLPSDIVLEVAAPKNVIKHQFQHRPHKWSNVHINTPILGQQIPHQNQPLVDHADEAVGAAAPGVAVSDLFQQIGLLVESLAADLDIHREVRADIEGWVDVDQFEATRVLDLAAQGAGLER